MKKKFFPRYAVELYKDSVLIDTICYTFSSANAFLVVDKIKSYYSDYDLRVVLLTLPSYDVI